jgi:hypothetical protein
MATHSSPVPALSISIWSIFNKINSNFYNFRLLHSQKRASCSRCAADLMQLAIIKPISGCVRIACSGLIISSLLQFVNRLAASCELQTWCKLWTAGLLQVVNCRLDASCELQACCKLWTADLMQVVNCRLDASSELQACCKLWTADLMQVVNCRLDASCELQACCKLWTADLMQVVNCRLDASCHPQTWCKLSKVWVRKAPYEASCIHYFEQ